MGAMYKLHCLQVSCRINCRYDIWGKKLTILTQQQWLEELISITCTSPQSSRFALHNYTELPKQHFAVASSLGEGCMPLLCAGWGGNIIQFQPLSTLLFDFTAICRNCQYADPHLLDPQLTLFQCWAQILTKSSLADRKLSCSTCHQVQLLSFAGKNKSFFLGMLEGSSAY